MMLLSTKTPGWKADVQLHVAIVLFGFSAILGKLIQLPGASIVWYRMLFTLLSLSLFPGILRKLQRIPLPALAWIALIGVLITLHWVTFFESIKYGNVSVTLSCMAATALMTAFIEPLFLRKAIERVEILLGVLVVLGFVVMFGFADQTYWLGMVIALVSALLIAIASVLNKRFVANYDVMAITWVEFLVGFLTISALMPLYGWLFPEQVKSPTNMDLLYLLLLALGCTTLGYTLIMNALKVISTFKAMLAINLEPVYGMLMAAFFFQEHDELPRGFYLGAGLILMSVFVYPALLKAYGSKASVSTVE